MNNLLCKKELEEAQIEEPATAPHKQLGFCSACNLYTQKYSGYNYCPDCIAKRGYYSLPTDT